MLRTCTSSCASYACSLHQGAVKYGSLVHITVHNHCARPRRPVDVVKIQYMYLCLVRHEVRFKSAGRASGYALDVLLPFPTIVDERNKFPASLLPLML